MRGMLARISNHPSVSSSSMQKGRGGGKKMRHLHNAGSQNQFSFGFCVREETRRRRDGDVLCVRASSIDYGRSVDEERARKTTRRKRGVETIDGADRSCKRVLPRKMSKAGAAAAAEYLRQSRHLRPLRRAQTEARRLIKSTPNSSGSLRGKAKDGEKRFSHL